ncbi:hypothetical protein C2S51_024589 [Perilla frutescens var. frutescens]|nr:hypothetical protein C2S51_024589 [Perilla frutescens var. frutescens]
MCLQLVFVRDVGGNGELLLTFSSSARKIKEFGKKVNFGSVMEIYMPTEHDFAAAREQIGYESAKTFLQTFHKARRVLRTTTSLGVEATNEFRIGTVVRDWKGELRAGLAIQTMPPKSVVEVEINDVLYRVGLCMQKGLVPYVVFSDSLLAVRLIKGNYDDESYLEEELPILAEVVKDGFVLDFKHMFREANAVAHTVACFGAINNGFVIWNNYFPQWLRELV